MSKENFKSPPRAAVYLRVATKEQLDEQSVSTENDEPERDTSNEQSNAFPAMEQSF